MRVVSFVLFLSLVIGAAPAATLQAQATSHSKKAGGKVSPSTKTLHGMTSARSTTKGARHDAAVKPAAAAPTSAITVDAASVAPAAAIALRDAPEGQPLAMISPRTTLQAIAHDRGWVRVRAEGWVKESEVAPVDSMQSVLSAADLRADPDAARGKHVRWNVEILAMATADPLRKGLNPDEPYLLVRGPGPESALLYVAVPASMLSDARQLASLAPVPVTLAATVRVGRSEPVGVPILDAQSLIRR